MNDTPSNAPSGSQELTNYNTKILELLNDLKQRLDGPVDSDQRQQALQLIDEVLANLQAQFELEESSGYMQEVLERYPNWYRQIQHLQQEHQLLHDQLKQIRDELGQTDTSSGLSVPLRRHIDDWVLRFRQHQEREDRILDDAFLLDVGQGE